MWCMCNYIPCVCGICVCVVHVWINRCTECMWYMCMVYMCVIDAQCVCVQCITMCVPLCVCLRVDTYLYMNIQTEARGWECHVSYILLYSLFYYFDTIFLTKSGVSWKLAAPRDLCSPPPHAWATGIRHLARFLCERLGWKLRSSYLCSKYSSYFYSSFSSFLSYKVACVHALACAHTHTSHHTPYSVAWGKTALWMWRM